MSSEEFSSFPAIAAYIKKLCQEKCTGTLLIRDNQHLLGQISFQGGEIVFLFSQGKRGIDAIPLLLKAKGGTVIFSEGKEPIRIPLPATTDILKYFSNANATLNPTTAWVDEREPLLNRSPLNRPLPASAKTFLEHTLKGFIGPVASIICADLLHTITTVDAAIEALADEIPNLAAAAQFRKLAHDQLG